MHPRIHIALWILAITLMCMARCSHAALPVQRLVPLLCRHYQADMIREARFVWGMSAPVATFAAQMQAESGCHPHAVSAVGAQGLTQLMPDTAREIGSRHADLRDIAAYSPAWSMRAQLHYDRDIWTGMTARNECHRMAKTLAGYNGGPGWVHRMERKATSQGKDAATWFGVVENMKVGRTVAAAAENRAYPRRILLQLEPSYVRTGYGGGSAEGDACQA